MAHISDFPVEAKTVYKSGFFHVHLNYICVITTATTRPNEYREEKEAPTNSAFAEMEKARHGLDHTKALAY